MDGLPVVCPECGAISDSIKTYTMLRWILFLGIFAQIQKVTYTCCAHCMRKHILCTDSHITSLLVIFCGLFWVYRGLLYF